MKNTDPEFSPELAAFFARAQFKAAAFRAIISELIQSFQPAELKNDGSLLILEPYEATKHPARITLRAYAPSDEAILINPINRFEEWQATLSIEVPARVLLGIAVAAVK